VALILAAFLKRIQCTAIKNVKSKRSTAATVPSSGAAVASRRHATSRHFPNGIDCASGRGADAGVGPTGHRGQFLLFPCDLTLLR
jgi:hypothetical protein